MKPLRPGTRGPSIGVCNICGTLGPLTIDHVPPRGCEPPTRKKIEFALSRYRDRVQDVGRPVTAIAPRISQSGLNYNTLCSRCNSGLLGTAYDPALIDFSKQVAGRLNSPLHLPSTMTFQIEPQKVARAVWGHMASVGIDRYLKGPHTEAWSEWFHDEALPPPGGSSLFYWLYPYRRTVVGRDLGLLRLGQRSSSIVWMLKFYPIAFAWVHPGNNFGYPLHDMTPYLLNGVRSAQQIPLSFRRILHEEALERPDTSLMIMAGRENVISTSMPMPAVVLRPKRR